LKWKIDPYTGTARVVAVEEKLILEVSPPHHPFQNMTAMRPKLHKDKHDTIPPPLSSIYFLTGG